MPRNQTSNAWVRPSRRKPSKPQGGAIEPWIDPDSVSRAWVMSSLMLLRLGRLWILKNRQSMPLQRGATPHTSDLVDLVSPSPRNIPPVKLNRRILQTHQQTDGRRDRLCLASLPALTHGYLRRAPHRPKAVLGFLGLAQVPSPVNSSLFAHPLITVLNYSPTTPAPEDHRISQKLKLNHPYVPLRREPCHQAP